MDEETQSFAPFYLVTLIVVLVVMSTTVYVYQKKASDLSKEKIDLQRHVNKVEAEKQELKMALAESSKTSSPDDASKLVSENNLLKEQNDKLAQEFANLKKTPQQTTTDISSFQSIVKKYTAISQDLDEDQAILESIMGEYYAELSTDYQKHLAIVTKYENSFGNFSEGRKQGDPKKKCD